MKKETLKQIEFEKERYSKMSNAELLDEVISLGGGDDYDIGCYTEIGSTMFDFGKSLLIDRLGDWYNETKP